MSERFCALCQAELRETDAASACPECGATYHEECHRENGGCGNYGCSKVPAQSAQAAAIPATVWGKETKTCPACRREIRAVATRCRHCGAAFSTVEAIAPEIFSARDATHDRDQSLRVRAGACFLGGAIPIFAPIVLLVGIPLHLRDRERMRGLPPFYRFLNTAGLGLAALWVFVGAVTLIVSREP